ncbi:MAG: DUF3365 domain-containing protein [Sulfurospirillum sp.]|nr:DUF3365 domain-containing protein [Sulfurospirillum sp.]
MQYNFKFIIGFFVILYAIITLLFFNFYKNLAIKDTKQEAISMLNAIKATRSYVNEIQRPIVENLKIRHLEEDFFDSRILSATSITQYIYDKQLLKKELKYKYKLVATNPLNPAYKANEFETKILNKFRQETIKDYFSLIKEDDKSYFFIAMPIEKNKKSCLQCHGNPKDAPKRMLAQYGESSGFYEEIGHLRAMIYLKTSIKSIISYHKEEFITGGITMFFVFIIFIILIYKIYKKDMVLQEKKENLFIHQNRLAVMGGMIGNISHQWKQPLMQLSYIFINLGLLSERNKLTNEKLTNKIEEADEQISFMSDTMNDFKNFFSPRKIKNKYKIVTIVKQSERLLKAFFEKYNIKLIIEANENFLFYGCKNELLQVFINIFNNAKDSFVSKEINNRVIHVKTYIKDDKNIITIQNNAGLIDEKVIDKIFEPYFSTKDLSVATGIGLYICKVIIENYKGTIEVENLEEGVIFTIKY